MEIFLSYSWKNESIADSLEKWFLSKRILVHRDKRDVTFTKSTKQFMKTIRNYPFCIMILSDSFLKSKNCMYEVNEFIKDENYRNKILPLVEAETNIFSAYDRSKYTQYWQNQYNQLLHEDNKIELLNKKDSISELKVFENIDRNIGEFLENISDLKVIKYSNGLSEFDFQDIMSVVSPEENRPTFSYDVDGYILLNVPRTIRENTFIWWEKDSNGYTTDVDKAKIFTEIEIRKKITDLWDNKKHAAIPIREVASKFGQMYIPYHYRFIKIVRDNSNLIIGNKNIYLTEQEVKQYI
jgi:hypothetical protein